MDDSLIYIFIILAVCVFVLVISFAPKKKNERLPCEKEVDHEDITVPLMDEIPTVELQTDSIVLNEIIITEGKNIA